MIKRKLTLEQRVARLERIIKNESDSWDEPDDLAYMYDDDYDPDDEWESPEYQDSRRRAEWDRERRENPWNYR